MYAQHKYIWGPSVNNELSNLSQIKLSSLSFTRLTFFQAIS